MADNQPADSAVADARAFDFAQEDECELASTAADEIPCCHHWVSVADVQADARPENIAAEAKVGGEDEDVREVMRELSPEKRNMILRRRGVRVADWEAKEKRIDSDVWDTLRRKGAPARLRSELVAAIAG